jgi:hypothetical protein
MSINSNQPINPVITSQSLNIRSEGLTKREYYSGIILQGLLTNTLHYSGTNDKVMVVGEAIELADELLKQLEKK